MFKFKFLDEVRCRVTGFQGVVTSIADYYFICHRYTVQPPFMEGKKTDSYEIDEMNLDLISSSSDPLARKVAAVRKFGMLDTVKEKISGFTGVVIAWDEYLNGCVKYSVHGKGLKENGEPALGYYFFESQLDLVEKAAANEREERITGGPATLKADTNRIEHPRI